MKPVWLAGACMAVLAVGCVPLRAQSVISARSGLVDLVEGAVFIGDKRIEAKYGNFPEVKENATLRTTDGRAEILLTPGVFLRIGENSSMRMITNRLIDTRLELMTGSAVIEAAEIAKDTGVTIVCKDAAITLKKAGIYRFDMEPARLRVFSGEAQVALGGREIEVGGGKLIAFEGESAAVVLKFSRESTDALDRWSRRRGEYIAMANISAAKSLRDSGYSLSSGMWRWNPYFGMMTFIPARGTLHSPYGYRYWSPVTVGSVFYTPPPMADHSGWNAASQGGYIGHGATSTGYSGTAASANSSGSYSAPAASAGSGSSSAGSSGGSTVGHGSSGGGGRGR